ncbi:MAG: PilN domain-containing protein [Candidatus Rokuibacteriota bacterium]
MAIRVNLLRREAAAQKRAGVSMPSMPRMPSIGGGKAMQGMVVLVAVVVLAIGFWAAKSYWERESYKKEITALKAQDAKLQLQLTELRLAETAKREIQRRIEIIGRVAKSQKVPHEMMVGVLQAVPQGIWLTSFDMKPQEVKKRVDVNRQPISYSSETLSQLSAKQQEASTGAPQRASGPMQTKEVTEIEGYSVIIRGMAFNNFQVAEFMDNLKKAPVFSDIDFNLTQAANVEQVRVMDFELTARVKLKL